MTGEIIGESEFFLGSVDGDVSPKVELDVLDLGLGQ